MALLTITSIENLQKEANEAVRSLKEIPGIYVSLNKTQKSIEEILKQEEINTEKLFFIDCVTSEKTREDVLHISPAQLDKLSSAINSFTKEINGKKFLILDALSTLLIYNSEEKVEEFIKKLTEQASKDNVEIIALTPATKGEELLEKIKYFFDKVEER